MLFKAYSAMIRPLRGKGLGKIPILNKIFQIISHAVIEEQHTTVEINGYKIHVNVDKKKNIGGIDSLLLFCGEYEPTTTKVFKECAKEGNKVIDIGANIGYFSLLGAKCVGKHGIVVAVEPEGRNFLELRNNIKLNEFENVRTLNMAVSSECGAGKLHVSDKESGTHSLVVPKSRHYESVQEILITTIDEIVKCDKTPISLIKMDTEGNEYEVIEGARETIETHLPSLIIELWPEGLNVNGHTIFDIEDLLRDMGYTEFYLIDDYKDTVRKAEFSEMGKHIKKHGFSTNILCK